MKQITTTKKKMKTAKFYWKFRYMLHLFTKYYELKSISKHTLKIF